MAFFGESRPDFMIGENRSVLALSGLVQLDRVIFDLRGLELLGDPLLHLTTRLAHLEKPRVRLVRNGVGVNARMRLRLRRKNFFNGLTHLRKFL